MNHLLHLGALTVSHGWILGVTTAVFLLCFVGWTWWAYSAGNRERMNQAARLPFMED